MSLDAILSRHRRTEQYELLPRTSEDSTSSTHSLPPRPSSNSSKLPRWSIWHFFRLPVRNLRSLCAIFYRQRGSRGRVLRCSCWILVALSSITAFLIVFTAIFRPSYSHLPDHYRELQTRCQESKEPGRANLYNERIFIAASLYDPDGSLVSGNWGRAVLELVELLGPQNVYLSVYEDDASPQAQAALDKMRTKIKGQCHWAYIWSKYGLTNPHCSQILSNIRASSS